MKLTLESKDMPGVVRKVEITAPCVTIHEVLDELVIPALLAATFHPDSIDDAILAKADDIGSATNGSRQP